MIIGSIYSIIIREEYLLNQDDGKQYNKVTAQMEWMVLLGLYEEARMISGTTHISLENMQVYNVYLQAAYKKKIGDITWPRRNGDPLPWPTTINWGVLWQMTIDKRRASGNYFEFNGN